MTDVKRFLVITTTLCFGLGIFFFIYFQYLEYKARQELPLEMRTPEAVQNYYDGSVCLGCDIAGMLSLMLFSSIGIFIIILWGIYETFSKKQQNPK